MIVNESCKRNLKIEKKSFFFTGLSSLQGECRPLFACGKQIGIIRPDVAYFLMDYPTVFTATPNAFYINPQVIVITLKL